MEEEGKDRGRSKKTKWSRMLYIYIRSYKRKRTQLLELGYKYDRYTIRTLKEKLNRGKREYKFGEDYRKTLG